MKTPVKKNIIAFPLMIIGLFLWVSFFPKLKAITEFNIDYDYLYRLNVYTDLNRAYMLRIVFGSIFFGIGIGVYSFSIKIFGRLEEILIRVPSYTYWVGFPIVFLLLVVMNIHQIVGYYPRIFDGFNYLFQAKNFALGQVAAMEPPAANCFKFPFIIMENGRWYGSIYPGYSLFLTLGVLLGQSWVVNPILAAISIAIFYFFAHDFFGEKNKAVIATLLLVISPFFRMMASIHMSHITAMLFSMLSVWFFMKWINHKNMSPWQIPLLLGVFVGTVYITRPQAGLVVLAPIILKWLADIIKNRYRFTHVLSFCLVVCLFYCGLSLYNEAVTGDPQITPRYHIDPGRRLGFGEDLGQPLPGGRRGGHSLSKGLKNAALLLNLMNSDFFGWGALGIWGIVTILLLASILPIYRKKYEFLFFASVGLNVLLYIFYFTPSPNFGPRYLTEVIPFVAILLIQGSEKIYFILTKKVKPEVAKSVRGCIFVVLLLDSIVIFSIFHWRHYGVLPPELKYSERFDSNELSEVVIMIPKENYCLNVFTWNSPDLSGNVFVPLSRECNADILQDAFPHRKLFIYKPETDSIKLVMQ